MTNEFTILNVRNKAISADAEEFILDTLSQKEENHGVQEAHDAVARGFARLVMILHQKGVLTKGDVMEIDDNL